MGSLLYHGSVGAFKNRPDDGEQGRTVSARNSHRHAMCADPGEITMRNRASTLCPVLSPLPHASARLRPPEPAAPSTPPPATRKEKRSPGDDAEDDRDRLTSMPAKRAQTIAAAEPQRRWICCSTGHTEEQSRRAEFKITDTWIFAQG